MKLESKYYAYVILVDNKPVAYATVRRIAEGIAAWFLGTISDKREIVPLNRLASKFDEFWPWEDESN
jgi:hypothetical protein